MESLASFVRQPTTKSMTLLAPSLQLYSTASWRISSALPLPVRIRWLSARRVVHRLVRLIRQPCPSSVCRLHPSASRTRCPPRRLLHSQVFPSIPAHLPHAPLLRPCRCTMLRGVRSLSTPSSFLSQLCQAVGLVPVRNWQVRTTIHTRTVYRSDLVILASQTV